MKTTIGILALALMSPMTWAADRSDRSDRSDDSRAPRVVREVRSVERPSISSSKTSNDDQKNKIRSVDTAKSRITEKDPAPRVLERPIVRPPTVIKTRDNDDNKNKSIKTVTPPPTITTVRPKVNTVDPKRVGPVVAPPTISATKVKATDDDDKNKVKPPAGRTLVPPTINRNVPGVGDDARKIGAGRTGTLVPSGTPNKNVVGTDANKTTKINRFQRPETAVKPLPTTPKTTIGKTVVKQPDSAIARPVVRPTIRTPDTARIGSAARGNARVSDVAAPKIAPKATGVTTRIDPIHPSVNKVGPVTPPTATKIVPVTPGVTRVQPSAGRTAVAPAAKVRAPRVATATPKTVANTVVVNKKVVNYTEINKTVINRTYVSDRYAGVHGHRDFHRPSYVRHDFHPRSSLDISFGFVGGGYGGDSFAFGFSYSDRGHLGYHGFGRCYDYSSFGFGFGYGHGGDVSIAAAFGYGPPPPVMFMPPPPPPVVVVADPYACYPVWYRPAVVMLPPPPPPVAVVAYAPPPPAPVVVAVDAYSCYPRWYRPSGIAVSAGFNINDSAPETPSAEYPPQPAAEVPAAPEPAADPNAGNADNGGFTTPALPDATDSSAEPAAPAQEEATTVPPAYDYGRITLEGEIRFRNE